MSSWEILTVANHRIEEGNLAEVVLDSFPDRKMTGRIESISRVARQLNRKDPRKYFECSVLIDVDADATDLLKPGMELEVSDSGGTAR